MAEIGTTLREARMRARIDISEVEDQTKIRAKYLRAIENEDWELLPGPVFTKSFLRTYSDFLGLDSRTLVDEFNRRYEYAPDYDNRPVAAAGRERERRLPRPALPRPGHARAGLPRPSLPRPRHARAGAPRTGLPAWVPIVLVLAAVVAGLYVLGSSGGSNKTSRHARAARGHHRGANTSPAPAPPAPPTTVTLQLVPTRQIYVCLVDGSGKQLIPGRIFAAGETIPTETSSKLLLTLGNAWVQMKVNGNSVRVSPSTTSIGFLLRPTGTSPLPAAQRPRCV